MSGAARKPSNVVVVLLDSLNRHMLGSYGAAADGAPEFETPNLDRFAAEQATRFTRHVTGSLPCMPARHDILCGALDFLWKPWGSIELWEQPITRILAHHNVTTALVTDHPHLFETGGENYHTDFTSWDFVRGHEGDPWRSYADPTWMGAPSLPARSGGWWMKRAYDLEIGERAYDRTRTFYRSEADYPGPKTMSAAAEFLREATPHHDRWFLFVDEFDPHEPFDTPERWSSKYQEEPWEDEQIIWPPYADGAISKGLLTDREGRHIRANYGAKLSMIDHWFGRILDEFDQQDLWENTALIVCTDHGHYLGEEREGRDIWGKPAVPQYEPIGHTPLFIHWPGVAGGGTCDALTTNVDIFATIADVYDAEVDHVTHGRSMAPLLTGEAQQIRQWALGGYFGNWVQITDGVRKYARGPVGENFPLSMWSNRWSTMPTHIPGIPPMPNPDERATLDRMPGSDIPVIRQPFEAGDTLPYWVGGRRVVDRNFLFDLSLDPDERENRAAESAEAEMVELLRTALDEVLAPIDQYQRLGLA